MNLDQEQKRLKAEWEARKARHPYPGGWRPHCRSTNLEDKAWKGFGEVEPIALFDTGPVYETNFMDLLVAGVRRVPRGECLVIERRLYASRGWIGANLTYEWGIDALSLWLRTHFEVRRKRVRAKLKYYDVADFIRVLSAAKAQMKRKLRPSVARMLHPSGSIDDALLKFVASLE